MDTGERLAAFLSGDLDADESAAVEAELARDERLRARLDEIRAADEALAALPDVELPREASERLHATIAAELDRQLGDELAARRARRAGRLPGWLPAVGGAAAAVAALAIGVGVVTTGAGQDAATTATDSGARTQAEADDGAAAGGQMATLEEATAGGPVIVALGRTVTTDDLASLAQADRFDQFVQQDLAGERALELSERHSALLGERPSDVGGGEGASRPEVLDAPDETAAESPVPGAAEQSARLAVTEGVVEPADVEAVARCLPVLSEGSQAPVVPLYAEVATSEDGRPVVVYAALGPSSDGGYERIEVWMLDRDTCELLQFVQQDR